MALSKKTLPKKQYTYKLIVIIFVRKALNKSIKYLLKTKIQTFINLLINKHNIVIKDK